MRLDELREHCLKTLKYTQKFPTKTFEEHALVLQLIRNQESIISKLEQIKKEIGDLDIHYDNDYFSNNKDGMYKSKEVLKILDKYIKESEQP